MAKTSTLKRQTRRENRGMVLLTVEVPAHMAFAVRTLAQDRMLSSSDIVRLAIADTLRTSVSKQSV